MSQSHGSVAWSELMTRDLDAARDYYGKVCGWSFETMKMDNGQDYIVASCHGRQTAGLMDMTGDDAFADLPPHWFTYLGVDDVDEATRQTRDAGGRVIRDPFDVAGVGRIAIVADPTGAAFGLITEEAQAGG